MIIFKAIYLTIAALVIFIVCIALSPLLITGGLLTHAVAIALAKDQNFETI